MQDMCNAIYTILQHDTQLITMLGGQTENYQRVYKNQHIPYADEFPRVTMFEMSNQGYYFADNRPLLNESVIRVDVWSKEDNVFDIAEHIQSILINTYDICQVSFDQTQYDSDTMAFHKPININIITESEDN